MDDAKSDGGKSSDSEWWQSRDQGAKYWSKNRTDFDARKLFNNAAFADVVIQYADKEIKAHRVILCTRSRYFKKLLDPDAQSEESKTGIIKLEDENVEAVEDMLHWLYSYEYFANFDLETIKYGDPDDWHRHLDAAIIAAKYGIAPMEKDAMQTCGCVIETFAEDIDVVAFAKRALDCSDKDGLLGQYIPYMAYGRFHDLFKDNNFRTWLARYPDIKQQLIDENFAELIKTKEFRVYLKADGDMALRYIDQLADSENSEDYGGEDRKGQGSKKRRLLDKPPPRIPMWIRRLGCD